MTLRPPTDMPDQVFDGWVGHFAANRARGEAIEAGVDWDTAADLPENVRTAVIRRTL